MNHNKWNPARCVSHVCIICLLLAWKLAVCDSLCQPAFDHVSSRHFFVFPFCTTCNASCLLVSADNRWKCLHLNRFGASLLDTRMVGGTFQKPIQLELEVVTGCSPRPIRRWPVVLPAAQRHLRLIAFAPRTSTSSLRMTRWGNSSGFWAKRCAHNLRLQERPKSIFYLGPTGKACHPCAGVMLGFSSALPLASSTMVSKRKNGRSEIHNVINIKKYIYIYIRIYIYLFIYLFIYLYIYI